MTYRPSWKGLLLAPRLMTGHAIRMDSRYVQRLTSLRAQKYFYMDYTCFTGMVSSRERSSSKFLSGWDRRGKIWLSDEACRWPRTLPTLTNRIVGSELHVPSTLFVSLLLSRHRFVAHNWGSFPMGNDTDFQYTPLLGDASSVDDVKPTMDEAIPAPSFTKNRHTILVYRGLIALQSLIICTLILFNWSNYSKYHRALSSQVIYCKSPHLLL